VPDPKPTPRLTSRIVKAETRKRREFRQAFKKSWERQARADKKRVDKWNKENKGDIDAGKVKAHKYATRPDKGELDRLEAVEFAPTNRLVRYAIDAKRRLVKGERSRHFNTRYIDKVSGTFVSKEDAKIIMKESQKERQVVEIMMHKNISYSEAEKHWQHLLDTKSMSYIIRIYRS
jgi:hypothetical protein